MSRLKILSIDWDYFINATAEERYTLFPDGGNENIPYYIQDIIWTTHYNGKLENIGVKEEDLELTKGLIAGSFDKIMITNSHKHIYNFIEENLFGDEIDVVNIDFHHDLFGAGDAKRQEVDCGNWMSKLFENYDCKYRWIKQEDSMKGVETQICPTKEVKFEDILNEEFDLLFICKSGVWSPPHLDKFFNDTFKPLLAQTEIEVVYETNVFDDRYNAEFEKIVTEQRKMIENIKNQAMER